MYWNWQLPDWPKFTYEPERITHLETKFLLGAGNSFAFLKTLDENEKNQFVVEILSLEGLESSRIEGEILERESLQSSIRKQFGLQAEIKKKSDKEHGMAELLWNVYENYALPLTHEMLWQWHSTLFKDWSPVQFYGKYRTHPDPMQIVSHRLDGPRVFFEAPASQDVPHEMELFIRWYNASRTFMPILGRAAIAHAYFESIHPFEDGNGRIGRILVEKVLSQGVGQPVLIAASKSIEKHKKQYYAELGRCNHTLKIESWVEFFASMILQAQEDSIKLLHFLIKKSKMLVMLSGKITLRQERALLRMFAEGPDGFVGGLSAEKYIAITKASRATTTRDLNDLVEKGALIKTGELRHTRYQLNI